MRALNLFVTTEINLEKTGMCFLRAPSCTTQTVALEENA
jgi:hypothetical protein